MACKNLRWQVSNWNENAIGFYKKIGATIDDMEINCDLALPISRELRGISGSTGQNTMKKITR